ncbi:hypothetical protein F8388_020068 [Cannabis sativa]|uniref:Uncharacterized protein n=1 Tax=Cannabis sativa TaxID=3483 RepID=A0A7J6HYR7_CANSA|nr:hypothetical protein F8388_020068 [Cannabis sativa]KAF4400444.1 hypothetical protein G4B88_023237 [Cannabis sativa]
MAEKMAPRHAHRRIRVGKQRISPTKRKTSQKNCEQLGNYSGLALKPHPSPTSTFSLAQFTTPERLHPHPSSSTCSPQIQRACPKQQQPVNQDN